MKTSLGLSVLALVLVCLALWPSPSKAQGILLTNTTIYTTCTPYVQGFPLTIEDGNVNVTIVPSNCSNQAQVDTVADNPDNQYGPACLATGCNGTWQFSQADLNQLTYNGSTVSLPMYCCACTEANCEGTNYQTTQCAAAASLGMVTNNYGESWNCYSESCQQLLEKSDGAYECIDSTCTGSMVVSSESHQWFCEDPSCTQMVPANYVNNTNWYCQDYCRPGMNMTYKEDYNETTNIISGAWECVSLDGSLDGILQRFNTTFMILSLFVYGVICS